MKEKLIEMIKTLDSLREETLNQYLKSLETFTVSKGSMAAIECVDILHDLDRHISNLEMEVKRWEVNAHA